MRSACGIEFPGSTYELRYLTVMTTLELDTVLPGIAPVTYVSGGPDGVGLIALRDHWRVAFRVPADETREEALDPSRIQARLRADVSDQVDSYPVSGSFIYFIHRRLASSFRAGRVLLAGDAAHVNSPSGGMGMNSGIHDAFAFSRVLAQVIHDELPAEALDEVAAERRRVARDVIGARSEQNYQDIVDTDADRRAARRRELARLGTDDDAAFGYLMRASMLDHAPRPAR
jgi:3-(3-hydroxy-phenyl)propionate hydroxylase